MNTDRLAGAWVGAAVLAVATLAVLVPPILSIKDNLAGGSAEQLVNQGGQLVGQAHRLAAAWTAVLVVACPVVGVLLMLLVNQLVRRPVPVAHQVLLLTAGAFVAAVLLTTGVIVSYIDHSYIDHRGLAGSSG